MKTTALDNSGDLVNPFSTLHNCSENYDCHDIARMELHLQHMVECDHFLNPGASNHVTVSKLTIITYVLQHSILMIVCIVGHLIITRLQGL